MKLKKEQFKEGENAMYIGTFKKKKDRDKFYHKKLRVGGLRVSLLKEYLEKIDNEDAIIGIYIDKKTKELVPIHCNKILLAPMIAEGDESTIKRQLEDERR